MLTFTSGRVNHWSTLQTPGYHLDSPFFPPLTSSHPLLPGNRGIGSPVGRCNSPAPEMEISDCDSVVVLVEEQTDVTSQLSQQSIPNPSSSVDKINKKQVATTEIPDFRLDSAPSEDARVSTTLLSPLNLKEEKREEDEDSQMMMSAEAQQLAEEILHRSLTSLNSSGYTDSRHRENALPRASSMTIHPSLGEQSNSGEKFRNEASCQTVEPQDPPVEEYQSSTHSMITSADAKTHQKMEMDQSSVNGNLQNSTDRPVPENTATVRSGSTIFVDLAKLQEDHLAD